jgi:hypothetical protein
LLETPIIESPTSDYPYRVIVARETAEFLIAALAIEIDYTNFKDEIDREHGRASWFSRACHDVWSAVWASAFKLRPPRPARAAKD